MLIDLVGPAALFRLPRSATGRAIVALVLVVLSAGKASAQFDLTGSWAPLADGGRLLLVTTIVEDPVYLTGPYIVSPHFKREPDGSKWDPTPCSSTW